MKVLLFKTLKSIVILSLFSFVAQAASKMSTHQKRKTASELTFKVDGKSKKYFELAQNKFVLAPAKNCSDGSEGNACGPQDGGCLGSSESVVCLINNYAPGGSTYMMYFVEDGKPRTLFNYGADEP